MPLYEPDTIHSLEQIKPKTIIRLVYVSSPTFKSRISPAIFKTLEANARQFNQTNAITGVLCYGNGNFLQCLEGEKKILMPLLQTIFDDNRHKNVKILLIQPIKERSFYDWGMRLLFLERWLWSPATKKQADALSTFLPFKPYSWSSEYTESFINAIRKIDTPPHVKHSALTLNAFGNMIQHVTGPHQAFILVQAVLSILVVFAVTMLYKLNIS